MITPSLKGLVVVFLVLSAHLTVVADEPSNEEQENSLNQDGDDSNEWDAAGDVEDDGEAVPWDNTEDDFEPMEDALPQSIFAVIHLSSQEISGDALEFVRFELRNYPTLEARDVRESPAKLRFFETQTHLTIFTLSTALENNAIPEDKLEEVNKISIPPREKVVGLPIATVDISELSVEEIQGVLADHNVYRVEVEEDDDNLDITDEEDLAFGEGGGESASPRTKRKPVDWRNRRAERMKKRKTDKEKKKKQQEEFNPAYKIAEGLGLGVPLPILFLVCVGGFGAVGYLGYALLKTMKTADAREESKRAKSAQKSQKRLSKSRKKRQ